MRKFSMAAIVLLLLFFFFYSLHKLDISNLRLPRAEIVEASSLRDKQITPLTLEHAVTASERSWGLMGRTSLSKDYGMTFNYPIPSRLSFWSFNSSLNLSLAYIDSNKVIREIYPLPAYFDKMDPSRTIASVDDFQKYTPEDPIIQFFQDHSVSSLYNEQYALEVSSGWFDNNGVAIGDVAIWEITKPSGYISHTTNIISLKPREQRPIAIKFNDPQYIHSLWSPEIHETFDIISIDNNFKVVGVEMLKAGDKLPIHKKQVILSKVPVKYFVVAPEGWAKRNNISEGDIWEVE